MFQYIDNEQLKKKLRENFRIRLYSKNAENTIVTNPDKDQYVKCEILPV